MSPQVLTVRVPATLYSRLKQSADEAQRTIEDELLELLTTALADHTVPRDLAGTVASLSSWDDARFGKWHAVSLPAKHPANSNRWTGSVSGKGSFRRSSCGQRNWSDSWNVSFCCDPSPQPC